MTLHSYQLSIMFCNFHSKLRSVPCPIKFFQNIFTIYTPTFFVILFLVSDKKSGVFSICIYESLPADYGRTEI